VINAWLFLKSGVGRVVAGFAAVLAIIAGIRAGAKREAYMRAELKAMQEAEKRRKAVQDAIDQSHSGGAADDWRKRLRDHG